MSTTQEYEYHLVDKGHLIRHNVINEHTKDELIKALCKVRGLKRSYLEKAEMYESPNGSVILSFREYAA